MSDQPEKRQPALTDTPAPNRTPEVQPSPRADAVEMALASALERAAVEGRWEIVQSLAGELEARRRARNRVVDLGEARGRRKG